MSSPSLLVADGPGGASQGTRNSATFETWRTSRPDSPIRARTAALNQFSKTLMKAIDRRTAIKLAAAGAGALTLGPEALPAQFPAQPFGAEFPNLDSLTTGEWWMRGAAAAPQPKAKAKKTKGAGQPAAPPMDVPRDEVVAFAIYTQHGGVLKMSAQLFPLKRGEPREARLELNRDGNWTLAAKADVHYPGWDAHFRIQDWDATKDVAYRVRHGEQAMFEGLIRR